MYRFTPTLFFALLAFAACSAQPETPAPTDCANLCQELISSRALPDECTADQLDAVADTCRRSCEEDGAPTAEHTNCEAVLADAGIAEDCAEACEPGATRCLADGGLATCVDTGDGLTEVLSDCPVDSPCAQDSDGAFCPVCAAGAASCADDTTRTLCSDRGDEMTLTDCGPASYCEDGACHAQACTPLDAGCEDHATMWTCADNGSERHLVACEELPACADNPAGCICADQGCTTSPRDLPTLPNGATLRP